MIRRPLPPIVVSLEDDGRVSVVAPYNENFNAGARELGGFWGGKQRGWLFPRRVETRVRALCTMIYHCDGLAHPQVDVEINLDAWPGFDPHDFAARKQVILAGRPILTLVNGEAYAKPGVKIVKESTADRLWSGMVVQICGLPELALDETGTDGVEVIAEDYALAEILLDREWLRQRLDRVNAEIAATETRIRRQRPCGAVVPQVERALWGIQKSRRPNAFGEGRTVLVHRDGCAFLTAKARITATEARKQLALPEAAPCAVCRVEESLKERK